MNVSSYSYLHENMRAEFRGGETAEDRARQSKSERGIALTGKDAVSISEKAREMYEARQVEETAEDEQGGAGLGADPNKEQEAAKGPLGGLFDDFDVEALGAVGEAIESVGASSGGKSDAPNTRDLRLKMLQKQIEAAQAELDKANQNLERVLSQERSGIEAESGDESTDVKDARKLVSELNNNLMQLKQQMAQATREAYGIGPGGGGQIQGTRAEGGAGSGTGAHIGKSTDPYAAAQAYEAAELAGLL
ncbi:hypothetical protein LJC26_02195 [Desulfovibrio sp. OttesenSCG-928-O18]|nr:hypothetical protein [Desulfovibrio sp. OttesenSCG-928-O18]